MNYDSNEDFFLKTDDFLLLPFYFCLLPFYSFGSTKSHQDFSKFHKGSFSTQRRKGAKQANG